MITFPEHVDDSRISRLLKLKPVFAFSHYNHVRGSFIQFFLLLWFQTSSVSPAGSLEQTCVFQYLLFYPIAFVAFFQSTFLQNLLFIYHLSMRVRLSVTCIICRGSRINSPFWACLLRLKIIIIISLLKLSINSCMQRDSAITLSHQIS